MLLTSIWTLKSNLETVFKGNWLKWSQLNATIGRFHKSVKINRNTIEEPSIALNTVK